MKNFTVKQLAKTAMIAALYTALTVPLGALASQSLLQIRPAEALTVLPLLFVEAIPGLAIGCMLSNIFSGYGIYDIIFGSLITLISAFLTRAIRKPLFAAFPPVILNAVFLPFIWLLMDANTLYFYSFFSTFATQAIWIYGLGIPLYYIIRRRISRA